MRSALKVKDFIAFVAFCVLTQSKRKVISNETYEMLHTCQVNKNKTQQNVHVFQ